MRELVLDPLVKLLQSIKRLSIEVVYRPGAKRDQQLITKMILNPSIGDKLILREVDGLRFNRVTVLRSGDHASGEWRGVLIALAVFMYLSSVLDDHAADSYIDDLA